MAKTLSKENLHELGLSSWYSD